jgi:Family of unknown function (DUF6941)
MDVEWLILGDAAQVNGGKLYLMGGGWDVLTINSTFPVNQRMGLAVSFIVPWNETNEKRDFDVAILTDDGEQVAKIGGQIEQGRPPGIPVGTPQRAQIAADLALQIKKPGVFSIVANADGGEGKRTQFRVVGGKKLDLPSMQQT